MRLRLASAWTTLERVMSNRKVAAGHLCDLAPFSHLLDNNTWAQFVSHHAVSNNACAGALGPSAAMDDHAGAAQDGV